MRHPLACIVTVTLLCPMHCHVHAIVNGDELFGENLLGHELFLNAIHLAGRFSGPRAMHERRCRDDNSSRV